MTQGEESGGLSRSDGHAVVSSQGTALLSDTRLVTGLLYTVINSEVFAVVESFEALDTIVVKKMDTAANSQSHKWKEKLETGKVVGGLGEG